MESLYEKRNNGDSEYSEEEQQNVDEVGCNLGQSDFSPLTAKVFNLNFHSLEVVSR